MIKNKRNPLITSIPQLPEPTKFNPLLLQLWLTPLNHIPATL
jgi:hypothetical protein